MLSIFPALKLEPDPRRLHPNGCPAATRKCSRLEVNVCLGSLESRITSMNRFKLGIGSPPALIKYIRLRPCFTSFTVTTNFIVYVTHIFSSPFVPGLLRFERHNIVFISHWSCNNGRCSEKYSKHIASSASKPQHSTRLCSPRRHTLH